MEALTRSPPVLGAAPCERTHNPFITHPPARPNTMRLAKVTIGFILLSLIATPAAAQFGFPEGEGPRMEVMRDIYNQIAIAGILVFLFVFGWLMVNLIRFRRGGQGRRTNEAHRGHTGAEVTWTVIPLCIMLWVGWISYNGMVALDFDTPETTHEIQIEGFQWFWKADYGNGVVINAQPGSAGEIDDIEPFRIPADTPVLFNITAGDVIHALWIPDLGVKVDAVPGRANFIWAEAPEGEYFTQCAEYCGLAHSYMRAKIIAMPEAEYDAWLREAAAAASGGGLSTEAAVTLTDAGLSPSTLDAIAGAELRVALSNTGTSSVTATLGEASVDVPAGATRWLNATLEAGEHTLSAGGFEAVVRAADAEVISVELDDFSITPDTYTLDADTTYIVQVVNVGQAPHNFFVGTFAQSDANKEVVWESATIGGGEQTSFLLTTGEAGTFDVWCNIPGHYQLGMAGTMTVA